MPCRSKQCTFPEPEHGKEFCDYHDSVLCSEIRKNGKRCTCQQNKYYVNNTRCTKHMKKYPMGETCVEKKMRENEQMVAQLLKETDEKDRIYQEKMRQYEEKVKKHAEFMKQQKEKARHENRQINFDKSFLLKSNGITDNVSYKAWIKINHPDKGGDTKLFQEIMCEIQKLQNV